MKALADAIYNQLLDMDYMDYSESMERDFNDLLHDLGLLEKQGNGSLLNAIKMLVNEVKK